MKEKKYLLGVFLLASVLRFYQLGQNPPSLDWDEASLGYNAYSLLKTGKDEYGNTWPISIRSFNDYKPPLYTYISIPFIAIFGLTEFSVRLPSVISGVIAVAVLYFITKELFSNHLNSSPYFKKMNSIPIISALLLCISPWHIQFSRVAFEANLALTCFMVAVLYLIKALKRPNNMWFTISSIFFVLTMYTYHSTRLIVPVFLCAVLMMYMKKLHREWKTLIPAALV